MKVIGTNAALLPAVFKMPYFMFHKRKVCNDLGVSELCHFFLGGGGGGDYPFCFFVFLSFFNEIIF